MKRSYSSDLFEDYDDASRKLGKNNLSSNAEVKTKRSQSKPVCQYGESCYRKNPLHFEEFFHSQTTINRQLSSSSTSSTSSSSSTSISSYSSLSDNISLTQAIEVILSEDKTDKNKPLMYLTKVTGIDDCYNNMAVDIQDILNPTLGTLVKSCQFNYCIDIAWLVKQYPRQFRSKPLLIVHGSNNKEKISLESEASNFAHIKLCNAPLDISYGTHHTKMMLLLYEEGFRVVITTANLVAGDWYQKTQGAWISPLFKKMANIEAAALKADTATSSKVSAAKSSINSAATTLNGLSDDSKTYFKRDLVKYLYTYRRSELNEWINIIKEHDMSNAKVFLIASSPGRHTGLSKNDFGHLKLREILRQNHPGISDKHQWSLVSQFSSVGSLGSTASAWLTGQFLTSLSASKGATNTLQSNTPLQLIFPTVDNVRLSLEGYAAGGSIPHSIHTARKQQYFNSFLNQWVAKKSGRSLAAPHIKTYTRVASSSDKISWFLLTSCNLSKAAWGCLEKNDSQLMIRSYELGVLFIPSLFCDTWSDFNVNDCTAENYFPLPYDVPLSPYSKTDKAWIWDIAHTDKPDSNGNQWEPPN